MSKILKFDEAARRFRRDPVFAEEGRDRYAYPGQTDTRGRHWASGGFIAQPFDRRLGWFDVKGRRRGAVPVAPRWSCPLSRCVFRTWSRRM